MANGCEICCEIMIAILLPPLGVCLRHGCCTVCLPLTLFISLHSGFIAYIYIIDICINVKKKWNCVDGVHDMFDPDDSGIHTGNHLRALCNRLRWSWSVLRRVPSSTLLRPLPLIFNLSLFLLSFFFFFFIMFWFFFC